MRINLILVLLLFPLFIFSNGLEKLKSLEGMQYASIGVSVIKIKDTSTVFSYNSNKLLTPASTLKLLISGLALEDLGGDFRYETHIYRDADIVDGVLEGNIIIESNGDPCFNSRYFPNYSIINAIVELLKENSISEIKGKVKVINEKKSFVRGSWLWEDISNYFGAIHHDFNYRDNTFILDFKSLDINTKPHIISCTPKLQNTTFENYLIAKGAGDNAWIYGGPLSNILEIRGSIPPNKNSFKIKGAIHNPALCFENEIIEVLKDNGIIVRENIEQGVIGTNESGYTKDESKLNSVSKLVLLQTIESPELKDIVFQANKMSVNLFLEAMGSVLSNDVVYSLNKMGLDIMQLKLVDFCGLSPLNKISAQLLSEFIVKLSNNKDFKQSLPLVGQDESIGYFASYPYFDRNLRAKTGSFSGVRAWSGYMTNQEGEELAFTIIINNYICSNKDLYSGVNEFLNTIYLKKSSRN